MKNAEMLQRCHEIANFLNDDDRAAFDFFQRHPEHDANAVTGGLGALISALIHDLERDINADECRAAGRLSPLKAAQRILKAAQDCPREALHGAWIAGDRQCICDGYRAFRLVEHLPGCTCRISAHRPELGGLYLESPAGDGLVLPCRRPQKRAE